LERLDDANDRSNRPRDEPDEADDHDDDVLEHHPLGDKPVRDERYDLDERGEDESHGTAR